MNKNYHIWLLTLSNLPCCHIDEHKHVVFVMKIVSDRDNWFHILFFIAWRLLCFGVECRKTSREALPSLEVTGPILGLRLKQLYYIVLIVNYIWIVLEYITQKESTKRERQSQNKHRREILSNMDMGSNEHSIRSMPYQHHRIYHDAVIPILWIHLLNCVLIPLVYYAFYHRSTHKLNFTNTCKRMINMTSRTCKIFYFI